MHKLKNNWLKNSDDDLFKSKDEAVSKIYDSLKDLHRYSRNYDGKKVYTPDGEIKTYEYRVIFKRNVLVCRIPRSKVDMQDSQLLFQLAIREAIELFNDGLESETNWEFDYDEGDYISEFERDKLIDGIDCIKRIKDVPTTHLTGTRAYPGITKDSCFISDEVRGRRILLIDDIYTLGVGVVEDCIQALYDKGAERVVFYAVGRTVKKSNSEATLLYNNDSFLK